MISVYMMITALTTTALGKGSFECNFDGNGQCFGAVGQPLLFHLPNTAINLQKDDNIRILIVSNNKTVRLNKDYVNQSEPFTGGTLKLGDAMKKHSGDYVMKEYGSNGSLLKTVHVHLEIQAPVSQPAVSQTCLSPEQMKVGCSSEAEGATFILTLDGQLLIRTRDHSLSQSNWTTNTLSLAESPAEQNKSRVSNVTISLNGQLTGNLMCNVRNNVSEEETVFHLKSCTDNPSFPVVTVAVIAGVVILLLFVALCLTIIKLQNKSRPRQIKTVNQDNSEDEIVYSDVKVIRNMKKT